MRWRYLFALFVGAVLAGWMMPTRQTPAPLDTAPMLRVQTEPASDPVLADDEPLESEATVLSRKPDGHFYTEAAVNGGAVRFMVDTGASAIALTGADAEQLGIEWDESDLQMVGRGVSGDVFGLPIVLKTVQVGEIVAHDVAAAVIPHGLDVSLLGQSFLSRVGNVNIQGDQMTFE
jgi:aspartyl protease family protein